ncbi:hypothetical protein ACFYOA_13235 [Streptomyces iakyrus]|uniref:hypothetical protein n=1 Tax=Streptomyces iakyrus TaxID=68219 RepID=UPI003689E9C9
MSDSTDAMSWMDHAHWKSVLDAPVVHIDRGFDARSADLIMVDGQHLYIVEAKSYTGGLVMGTGAGKTRSLLSTALWLSHTQTVIRQAQERWADAALTRDLLASSEEATKLPSITTPTICFDLAEAWAGGPLPSLCELTRAAEVVTWLRHVVLGLLGRVLRSHGYEFGPHGPPNEASPCGVIRFAAPCLPRAPGEPAYSPVSAISGVLAA